MAEVNTNKELGKEKKIKIFVDKKQEEAFGIALSKYKDKNFEGKKGNRKTEKDKIESAKKTVKDMMEKNKEAVNSLAHSNKEQVVNLYGEPAGYLWEAAQNLVLKETVSEETAVLDEGKGGGGSIETENAQDELREQEERLEIKKNELKRQIEKFNDRLRQHSEDISKIYGDNKNKDLAVIEKQIIKNKEEIEKSLTKVEKTFEIAKNEEDVTSLEQNLEKLIADLNINQESIEKLITQSEQTEEKKDENEKIKDFLYDLSIGATTSACKIRNGLEQKIDLTKVEGYKEAVKKGFTSRLKRDEINEAEDLIFEFGQGMNFDELIEETIKNNIEKAVEYSKAKKYNSERDRIKVLDEIKKYFPSKKDSIDLFLEKKEENEKKEKEALIFAAKNKEDLFAALDEIGEIKGSSEKYSPEVLKRRLEDFFDGKPEANSGIITREFGIRDKAEELFKSENAKKVQNKEKDKGEKKILPKEVEDFKKEADEIRSGFKQFFSEIQEINKKAKNPETKKIFSDKYNAGGSILASFENDYKKVKDEKSDQEIREKALARMNKNKEAVGVYLENILKEMQEAEKGSQTKKETRKESEKDEKKTDQEMKKEKKGKGKNEKITSEKDIEKFKKEFSEQEEIEKLVEEATDLKNRFESEVQNLTKFYSDIKDSKDIVDEEDRKKILDFIRVASNNLHNQKLKFQASDKEYFVGDFMLRLQEITSDEFKREGIDKTTLSNEITNIKQVLDFYEKGKQKIYDVALEMYEETVAKDINVGKEKQTEEKKDARSEGEIRFTEEEKDKTKDFEEMLSQMKGDDSLPEQLVKIVEKYSEVCAEIQKSDGYNKIDSTIMDFWNEWNKTKDEMINNPEEEVVEEKKEGKKGIFGRMKDFFGGKKEKEGISEVRKKIGEGGLKTITSIVGVKTLFDIALLFNKEGDIYNYFSDKIQNKEFAKELSVKFGDLLKQHHENKNIETEVTSEKGVAFIAKAREVFALINSSDRIDKKEKQEMKNVLKKLVRKNTEQRDALRKDTMNNLLKTTEAYTIKRANAVGLAKDALNLALSASGAVAARAAMYGVASVVERYMKVYAKDLKSEVRGETKRGILKGMTWDVLVETGKQLNIFDKNKTKWQKGTDLVMVAFMVMRGVGIYGLGVEQFMGSKDIKEDTLNGLKDVWEKGLTGVFEKGGALYNIHSNIDRLISLPGKGWNFLFGGEAAPVTGSPVAEQSPVSNVEQQIVTESAGEVPEEVVNGEVPSNENVPDENVEQKTTAANVVETKEEATVEVKNNVEQVPVSEQKIEVDTTIHKGDGYYDVFRRQIEADPEKFGYQDEGDVDDFIERKTREFLKVNDLWNNGKGVGLRYDPEARIVLHTDGTFEQVGVKTYNMEILKDAKNQTPSEFEQAETIRTGARDENILEKLSEKEQAEWIRNKAKIEDMLSKTNQYIQENPDAKDIKEVTLLKEKLEDSLDNPTLGKYIVEGTSAAHYVDNHIEPKLEAVESISPAETGKIDGPVEAFTKFIEPGGEFYARNPEQAMKYGMDMAKITDPAEKLQYAQNILQEQGVHKDVLLKSLGVEERIAMINEEGEAAEIRGKEKLALEKEREMATENAKTEEIFKAAELRGKALDAKWEQETNLLKAEAQAKHVENEQLFKELQEKYGDDPKTLDKLDKQLGKNETTLDKTTLDKSDVSKGASAEKVIENVSQSLGRENIQFFNKLPHVKNAIEWAKEYDGVGSDSAKEHLAELYRAQGKGDSKAYLEIIKDIEKIRDGAEKVKDTGIVGILNKEDIVGDMTAKPLDPEVKEQIEAIDKEAQKAEIDAKAKMAEYAAQQEEQEIVDENKAQEIRDRQSQEERLKLDEELAAAEKETQKTFQKAFEYIEEKGKEVDFAREIEAGKQSFNIQKEIKELEKLSAYLQRANEKGISLDKDDVDDFVSKLELIKRNSGDDQAMEAIKDAENYLKKGGKMERYFQMVEDAVSQVLKGASK